MTAGVRDHLDTAITRARNVACWQRHLGPELDVDTVVAGLADGTLCDAFERSAAARPVATALDVGGTAVTYAQLMQRARGVTAWLDEHAVGRDLPVLLALPTSVDLVAAYVGCLAYGVPVTFVNPASTVPEMQQLLDRTGADAAIAKDDALALLRPRLRLAADPDTLPRDGAPAPRTAVTTATTAIIGFTSGTTGRPKAVPLTHGNLLASIRAVLHAWRWTSDDVLLHALPLYHQHGLTGLQASLVAGGTAVVLPRFDAEELCAAVQAHRATVLFSVPAIWERLVATPAFPRTDLSSLRLATSGSAPLSPALAERVADVLGEPPLERYGMTESGLDVSNLYDGERRLGSVGWPLPGIEVAVTSSDGRPAPDGEDGEVVLRGPQVFHGYLDRDDNAGAFTSGGWFRTGDIGRLDPRDGCLTITGRAKELIITGGLNVYPREVELALEQIPGVARAAVVGAPSQRWGEEVVAFVVAGAGVTADDVVAGARERLTGYKCPKRVLFVAALPTNAMGKIQRDVLAARAEQAS